MALFCCFTLGVGDPVCTVPDKLCLMSSVCKSCKYSLTLSEKISAPMLQGCSFQVFVEGLLCFFIILFYFKNGANTFFKSTLFSKGNWKCSKRPKTICGILFHCAIAANNLNESASISKLGNDWGPFKSGKKVHYLMLWFQVKRQMDADCPKQVFYLSDVVLCTLEMFQYIFPQSSLKNRGIKLLFLNSSTYHWFTVGWHGWNLYNFRSCYKILYLFQSWPRGGFSLDMLT